MVEANIVVLPVLSSGGFLRTGVEAMRYQGTWEKGIAQWLLVNFQLPFNW